MADVSDCTNKMHVIYTYQGHFKGINTINQLDVSWQYNIYSQKTHWYLLSPEPQTNEHTSSIQYIP